MTCRRRWTEDEKERGAEGKERPYLRDKESATKIGPRRKVHLGRICRGDHTTE
jgi:hypothetical protein